MEEKIDYFGKYSQKMHDIHFPILSEVIAQLKLDFNISLFDLIQCNFSEYLDHHPEEPKYFFLLFKYEFEGTTGNFTIAFNTQFFKSTKETQKIVNNVKNAWKISTKVKIEYISEIKSIYELDLEKFEMLQTLHYLYPQKNLIEEKIDYQIFKIIYPYNTLKPVLKTWDCIVKV